MNNQHSIMVVEDDHTMAESICDKLEKSGYDTSAYESGSKALEAIKNGQESPSLIWLDYYLGDTNGLEFVKALKEHEKGKNIPIFVISNSAGGDKVKKIMDLGVDEYLVKANYTLKEIVKKIEETLAKS